MNYDLSAVTKDDFRQFGRLEYKNYDIYDIPTETLISKVKEDYWQCVNEIGKVEEQEQSYECLNKNGYDQDKCAAYFDNYNTCKRFWGKVYSERKAKGVYPYLPEVEDRAKIKEDYFKRVREEK